MAELRAKAAQIRDLAAGTLDSAVDPAGLFTVSFGPGDEGGAGPVALSRIRGLLESVARGERRPARGRKPTITSLAADDLAAAREELWQARAAFLALAPSKRQALLRQHQARRQEARDAARQAERERERLGTLRATATALRSFMAGELDENTDPRGLLAVNLLDEREFVLDPNRRPAFLADAPEVDGKRAAPPAGDAANDEPAIDRELTEAARELDDLRVQYLTLSAEERQALMDTHQQRIRDRAGDAVQAAEAAKAKAMEDAAARAAEEQARALEAARRAQNEATRLVEEERARLLGVKAAQARFESDLEQKVAGVDAATELALSWARRARELADAPASDLRRRGADQAYSELVGDLTRLRAELRVALADVGHADSAVPSAGAETASELPAHVDRSEIDALNALLAESGAQLRRREATLRWDRATGLRNAMVAMNRVRLRLLGKVSDGRKRKLTGFGADGVAQARRELDQITLELRYHFVALPRSLRAKVQDLRTAPGEGALVLGQLLLLLLAFRWWRRRADGVLDGIRKSWAEKKPQTGLEQAVTSVAWYARRVRKPVEWLLVLALLSWLVPGLTKLPELQYPWLIALWFLFGWLVIRTVDAIAARQPNSRTGDDTSRLRYRSLLLVGVTVVVVGLLLSLAEATVGRGTIHSWMRKSFWLLSIPVFLILVAGWRRTIFARIASRQHKNRLLAWVGAHERGLTSFAAAPVGGVYLFVEGLYLFAIRQASHFAFTRRVLAYLFRREVEKQAQARGDDDSHAPIAGEHYDALSPATPSAALVESVMEAQVATIRALVRRDNNALIAVVGERGLGKTTFLDRVADGLAEGEILRISCQPGGFGRFLVSLGESLVAAPTASQAELVHLIRQRQPTLIVLDDAQRLIRPIIGGLRDMDRMVELAHEVGPTTSWLLAVGAPAWQYLRRARGNRAVFDEVVTLERWDEAQIGQLANARAAELGLAPSFDELVVPRQIEVEQMSERERTERDYFRILWDYADGNPSIALHFWRESLFVRDGGQVVVRLFRTMPLAELQEAPGSLHFVLRAILQLELAAEPDIVECTNLHAAEVADALRAARARHWIERVDQRNRLTLPWYRAITVLLRRQHLVSG